MLSRTPLSAIRAFEAAARLGSFRAAAAELNLSPSAISHGIVNLERTLGTTLFERSTRVVRLTADGEIFMRHASTAFEELRRGIENVSARRSNLLRLHSAPSFAAQILSPRLSSFLALHPGFEVRLAASTEYVRFVDGEFDADIVYGAPRGEDMISIALGEEIVTPICAPDQAASIEEPSDILQHKLIRSDNKRIQWPQWFDVNDLGSPPAHSVSFDRSFLAIAAATDGLGVALESTRLAQRELASGRLVAPLLGKSNDVRYVGHHLCLPRSGSQRRMARTFGAWLLAELGEPPANDLFG